MKDRGIVCGVEGCFSIYYIPSKNCCGNGHPVENAPVRVELAVIDEELIDEIIRISVAWARTGDEVYAHILKQCIREAKKALLSQDPQKISNAKILLRTFK